MQCIGLLLVYSFLPGPWQHASKILADLFTSCRIGLHDGSAALNSFAFVTPKIGRCSFVPVSVIVIKRNRAVVFD
jgi:hypothetical protein